MRIKKSVLERKLDEELRKLKGKKISKIINILLASKDLEALMEYANIVSIKRLNYNDHGRVHAKIVSLNALKILDLIRGRVPTNLQKEGIGEFEDSRVVVLIASFLHDVGMSMGRHDHTLHSVILSRRFILDLLGQLYKPEETIVLQAMINEAIIGHMGTKDTTSVEAGVVAIADGCDISSGRSRIPLLLHAKEHRADIHEYSANAVSKVNITRNRKKALFIRVEMNNPAGIFQIEQVLLPKIKSTVLKDDVKVEASLGKEKFKYL